MKNQRFRNSFRKIQTLIRSRIQLKFFLVIFAVVLLLPVLILGYINVVQKPALYESTIQNLEEISDFSVQSAISEFKTRENEVLYFASSTEIHAYTEANTTQAQLDAISDIEHNFFHYANNSLFVCQVRLLNSTGSEIVRVNRDLAGQNVEIVPTDELQNKFHRDYFQDIAILESGEIYLSHLNLNIENFTVEIINGHYVPVIRYGTPLYYNATFQGMIVINYYADWVFDMFLDLYSKIYSDSEVKIVESNGYILFSTREDTWTAPENLNTNITLGGCTDDLPEEFLGSPFNSYECSSYLNFQRKIPLTFSDPNFQLHIVINVPLTAIYSPINWYGFILILFISICGIIITALIVIVTSKLVTGPIKILNQKTQEIADGNLNVDFSDHPTYGKQDEIGILFQNISLLQERLRRKFNTLHKDLDTLKNVLPICSNCKKVRDDDGKWMPMDEFIREKAQLEYTHGLCAECTEKLYGDFLRDD